MGLVLRLVWGAKVCLTGWSAYRACSSDVGVPVVCGLSVFYFGVLALATVCSWKRIPKPQDLDALEADYLRRLEEGLESVSGKMKQG